MKEGVDYEMIPDDNESWNIRILTGTFVETVFKFGTLQVTEDGESLKYNANVILTPNNDIAEDDDEEWNQVTGEILLDLLEEAVTKDELRANNPS